MSTTIQLISIGVLIGLGIFAWQNWKRPPGKHGPAQNNSRALSVSEAGIEQVRAGGMIQLPPHSEAMEAKDVQITARHVYEENGFQWFELEGDSGSDTVWLEVSHDDELETSVTLKRLSLEDIGLIPEALQPPGKAGSSAKVVYDNHSFAFVERGHANFRPAGDATQAEPLEYWDFEGNDNKHDPGIERWDDQYRVYLSQRIDPARIRIYSLGENA